MMRGVVSTRYAEAFLQYAKGTIGFENGVQELLAFRQVLSENPDLKEFMETPDFGEQEKFPVIDKVVAAGDFAAEIGHLLKLLIRKERIQDLPGIIEYIRMNYGYGDAVTAVLTSAFPLDDDGVKTIKDGLERKIKRRVILFVTFDSELLGGVKVRIGNKVYDGSLKRQLTELRERLINRRTE